MLIVKCVNALCLMLLTFSAVAEGITDAELSALPPLCAAKIKKKDEALWRSQFKHDDWIHLHHYCGGLNALNRLLRYGPEKAKGEIDGGLWEFNYVLKGTSQDCSLRPDMHYGKGKLLQHRGEVGSALLEFLRAIEIKPNHVGAILAATDIYLTLKKRENALALLEKGLLSAPETKSLQRKYTEMGGDIALINKNSTTIKEAAKKPEPANEAESKEVENKHKALSDAPGSTTNNKQAPAINNGGGAVGMPSNPWCRFCPDSESSQK